MLINLPIRHGCVSILQWRISFSNWSSPSFWECTSTCSFLVEPSILLLFLLLLFFSELVLGSFINHTFEYLCLFELINYLRDKHHASLFVTLLIFCSQHCIEVSDFNVLNILEYFINSSLRCVHWSDLEQMWLDSSLSFERRQICSRLSVAAWTLLGYTIGVLQIRSFLKCRRSACRHQDRVPKSILWPHRWQSFAVFRSRSWYVVWINADVIIVAISLMKSQRIVIDGLIAPEVVQVATGTLVEQLPFLILRSRSVIVLWELPPIQALTSTWLQQSWFEIRREKCALWAIHKLEWLRVLGVGVNI